MKILEINMWDCISDFKMITTNGVLKNNGYLVMGAGVALQAVQKFPGIQKDWGKHVKANGNVPYFDFERRLISCPTKHNWKDKSDMQLIKSSLDYIENLFNDFDYYDVAIPLLGCGNGGLNKDMMVEFLSKRLSDRYILCLGEYGK